MIIYLDIGYSIDAKGWYVNKKLVKQIVGNRLTYIDGSSILFP